MRGRFNREHRGHVSPHLACKNKTFLVVCFTYLGLRIQYKLGVEGMGSAETILYIIKGHNLRATPPIHKVHQWGLGWGTISLRV